MTTNNLTNEPIDVDEIREKILKSGTVRMASVKISAKMFEDGTSTLPEMKSQEIVEIGIDDLMKLIQSDRQAWLESILPEKWHKEEYGQTWFNQAIDQIKENAKKDTSNG